jgi:hypothetical protein
MISGLGFFAASDCFLLLIAQSMNDPRVEFVDNLSCNLRLRTVISAGCFGGNGKKALADLDVFAGLGWLGCCSL